MISAVIPQMAVCNYSLGIQSSTKSHGKCLCSLLHTALDGNAIELHTILARLKIFNQCLEVIMVFKYPYQIKQIK